MSLCRNKKNINLKLFLSGAVKSCFFIGIFRFYYKHHLADRIKADALNINIFTNKTMQGNAGVSVNVTLPGMTGWFL